MLSLRDRIVTCFIDRAPNLLTAKNLQSLLHDVSKEEIENQLKLLVDDKTLVSHGGMATTGYTMASYEGLPIRESTVIGRLEIPRFVARDAIRAEDVNLFNEAIAKRLVEIESRSGEI